MQDQEASLQRARLEASLADGVSWGMGEDAIQEVEVSVTQYFSGCNLVRIISGLFTTFLLSTYFHKLLCKKYGNMRLCLCALLREEDFLNYYLFYIKYACWTTVLFVYSCLHCHSYLVFCLYRIHPILVIQKKEKG